MKGFVFTAFLDMVAKTFSDEMVERIIDASDLPNQGAYTEVGTYDHQEMVRLVTHLSEATGIPILDLEVIYGKYLFTILATRYSNLILKTDSLFEFLVQVDKHVHVEVLKLYPEAELPSFGCEILSPDCMTLKYQSNHPFGKLAEGLILGAAEFFNVKVNIQSEDLGPSETKKHNTLFTIKIEK